MTMDQQYDIVCIGCMVEDLLLSDVPKDFYLRDTIFLQKMESNIGGDAANQAVISAHLGNRTALVSERGADGSGQWLHEFLTREGVDTSMIEVVPGRRTPTSVLAITDGDRHAMILPLSETGYGRPELDYGILDRTKAVSIGSMKMYPRLDEQLPAFFRAAREKGVITAGDVMQKEGPDTLREVYPYLDYFFPNETEGEEVTGESDPEKMAEKLLSWGVGCAVIKLGGKGCYVNDSREAFYVPARRVEAVDTTGAGDNFVAGFLTALVHGLDHRRAAEFATAVSSICVQHIGTTTGVKNLRQVLDVLGWESLAE